MDNRIISAIMALFCFSAFSSSQSGEKLIFEAAVGVASRNTPFTSDWSGCVGEGGLLLREFAFRITYDHNSHIGISSTIGHLNYWYEENIDLMPPFGGWSNGSGARKALYFRPTLILSSELGRLDIGILLYRNERGIHTDENHYFPFDGDHRFKPAIGIELGDQDIFVYGRFLNSYPLISGGGVYEIGMAGRSEGLYEHKFYIAVSENQGGGLGYRGEFRVYNKIAITPGLLIGGDDDGTIYMISFGIKAILDHSAKKSF
jgi:hypothetical protein